jgi:hypothetical protein
LAICVVVLGVICSCIFYYLVHERDNPLPGTGYEKHTKPEAISQKEECNEESATHSQRNKKRPSRFSFKGMIKSHSADKICKTRTLERKISSMSCPESDVLDQISSISSPENDIEMATLHKSNRSSSIPGILKDKSKTHRPSITKKRISFVSSHSIIEEGPQVRLEIAKPNGGLRKHWKEWFKEPSFYQASQFLDCLTVWAVFGHVQSLNML